MSNKTPEQVTADLQAELDALPPIRFNRAASWMRLRRILALRLRADGISDYFVKVRATRADREAGRIQVRALFEGQDVGLTVQTA